jgi:NAD-dependent dihydropyrimidine dehydrogenase PreA subunit
MVQKKVYATPNMITPNRPVIFDPDICRTGCKICVDVCQMDVLIPNPETGKPPLRLFPDECWYCGTCVEDCPEPGAIRLNHPLINRVRWKRKDTGEHFRV